MSEAFDSASRRKVVVIGGGAAGIFTAYELAKRAPDRFDVTVLEWRKDLGGHTKGDDLTYDGKSMHVDCGAQFFFERSEPDYCEMLDEEGFFANRGEVTVHTAGMTVYDATQGKLTIRVPSSSAGLYWEVIRSPRKFMRLKKFIKAAEELYNQGDWSLAFGDWFASLNLGSKRKGGDTFKDFVVRPLMYQFGLVQPSKLDSLSALFVIYFFVNSLPDDDYPSRIKGGGLGSSNLFQVYCLKNGMDGVLQVLKERHELDVECNARVRSIKAEGQGWKVEYEDGRTRPADEIVFATNPSRTLQILPEDASNASLRSLLQRMPYVQVPVHIQAGEPAYMPRKKSSWELANVRLLQNGSGTATHYMMTAWFGPVREASIGRAFFKSWGSPRLEPHDAPTAAIQVHELMVGTPGFIAARQELREKFQGRRHLWFAGGYILDYDSQNACLRAARDVAQGLEHASRFTLFDGLDGLTDLPRSRDLHEEKPVSRGTSFLRWL